MVRHCDFCGANLEPDEQEKSDTLGKDVCEECLHGGIEMLRRVLKKGK